MAKKAADSILVNTAERVGRTLGRVANRVDSVKAMSQKALAARRRGKKAKKRSAADVEAEARRAKAQASWKGPGKRAAVTKAAAARKVKSGTIVDERAIARSTAGRRWAARKPG